MPALRALLPKPEPEPEPTIDPDRTPRFNASLDLDPRLNGNPSSNANLNPIRRPSAYPSSNSNSNRNPQRTNVDPRYHPSFNPYPRPNVNARSNASLNPDPRPNVNPSSSANLNLNPGPSVNPRSRSNPNFNPYPRPNANPSSSASLNLNPGPSVNPRSRSNPNFNPYPRPNVNPSSNANLNLNPGPNVNPSSNANLEPNPGPGPNVNPDTNPDPHQRCHCCSQFVMHPNSNHDTVRAVAQSYQPLELRWPNPPVPIWLPAIETVQELFCLNIRLPNSDAPIHSIYVCKVDNNGIGLPNHGYHWALLLAEEGVRYRGDPNGYHAKLSEFTNGWLVDTCAGLRSEQMVTPLTWEDIEKRCKKDLSMTIRITSTSIPEKLCLGGVMIAASKSQKASELCCSVVSAKDMAQLEASTRVWCVYMLMGLPGLMELDGLEPNHYTWWGLEAAMSYYAKVNLGQAIQIFHNKAWLE